LTDGYEPGVRSRERVRQVMDGLATHANLLGIRHPVHIRREVCAAGDADEVAEWIQHGRIGLLSWGDHLPKEGDADSERRVKASLARRLNGHAGDLDRMLAEARARSHAGEQARLHLSALARAHGLAVASHDDASPDEAEASAGRGATICEFPACLATAQRARDLGMAVLMGAPNAVRGGSHLGWMSAEAAVRGNACDALCSDYHHPCLLHAPFALVQRGACDLATAWRLVSTGPARAAGLADRGRLASGQLADLVLVEPGPQPRVRSVWVGGREVGRFTGSSQLGA
jgi:alpha-D-ribose 1-methylphosphonate 5-triphosphate diphosphatase